MGAGALADSTADLIRFAVAWTLERALRFAVATCVVALLLATTLSGDAAERFATAAYLAVIFGAIVLALQRFFPHAAQQQATPPALFPTFLGYSLGVIVFLTVVAGFVSQPRVEVLAFFGTVGLIAAAVVVRGGSLSAFGLALSRGGILPALSRYAVVGVVGSLAIAALLGSEDAESVVRFGFRMTVVATLLLAASLLATTKLGHWVQSTYVKATDELDRLTHAFVFERTAVYAAIAAVVSMIWASVLPQPFSGAFAMIAYFAGAAGTVSVAMECRRLRS